MRRLRRAEPDAVILFEDETTLRWFPPLRGMWARRGEQAEVPITGRTRICPACSGPLWSDATIRRTVVTLEGLVRLRLQIRSCRNSGCPRLKVGLRPEQESRFALPRHEFGLDVIALVGRLRHAEYRSVLEIHAEATEAEIQAIAQRLLNLVA